MATAERAIAVYTDWAGLPAPLRLGMLRAQRGAGRKLFAFEYDAAVLRRSDLAQLHLDPRPGLDGGRQHAQHGRQKFGVFTDTSPDRWGRLPVRRWLEREQRAGVAPKDLRLVESDYLLGVHDAFRAGALRFRLDDAGDFLDNRHDAAAPPFVHLRELQAASLALEPDEDNTAPGGDQWLHLLIAPGGSLGGARPKASVVAPDGRLWIAKFPSVRDDHDMGAFELVVQTLRARLACRWREAWQSGWRTCTTRFSPSAWTALPTADGRRLHLASAMTLTGRQDGDDAAPAT